MVCFLLISFHTNNLGSSKNILRWTTIELLFILTYFSFNKCNAVGLSTEVRTSSTRPKGVGTYSAMATVKLQCMVVGSEFLKAGILRSRIPDIVLEEFGHFRTILLFPDYFPE